MTNRKAYRNKERVKRRNKKGRKVVYSERG